MDILSIEDQKVLREYLEHMRSDGTSDPQLITVGGSTGFIEFFNALRSYGFSIGNEGENEVRLVESKMAFASRQNTSPCNFGVIFRKHTVADITLTRPIQRGEKDKIVNWLKTL